ncbi:MAG: DUF58 domain-containing protein [Armatimonadetes bacterium]|jgi:uncharacterized protein (DUF58 family)|nr:DUF58 domain-containing protein [Armatimonadota bacterium]MDI9584048.1 DUF58 domain-containing protein [Acidobacteriota bacterium]
MKRRRMTALATALAFLVIALVFRIGFFAYAFYAAMLVAAIAYLMTYVSLDGLTVQRHCTMRNGEIGEEAVVTVGIRNQKPNFVPWVIMEDILSDGVTILEGANSRAMVMRPMGATTLRYRIRCDRRGYHRIGPVLFESGDFFGLTRRFVCGPDTLFITIYPKVLPIDKYSVPTHRPLGETTVRMRIFEDPTRIAGVREYQQGDPLRRVHWKASARTGQLHSKIYEPSSVQGANIILDFNTRSWDGSGKERRTEFACTVAASLASHLASRGVDLGFVSNGVDAADVIDVEPISVEVAHRDEARQLLDRRKVSERLRPVEVAVRRGQESIMLVMESLARLELSGGFSLAEMIAREYNAWPREDTVILIVPELTPELGREIARLKSTGFSVLVLMIDNPNSAPRAQAVLEGLRVPMIHLRRETDLHSIVI